MSDRDHGHLHSSHPRVVARLKRASGHLAGVIDMIQCGRPCLDVAQQLHAVEKAVSGAKRALIRDHLDHCLEAAMGPLSTEQRRTLDDMNAITRHL